MFFVKFIANDAVLYGLTDDYGTEFLNIVKKENNIKCNDYSKFIISMTCPYIAKKRYEVRVDILPNININNIERFKNKTVVNVYIPDGFLGKYIKYNLRICYKTKYLLFKNVDTYVINFVIDNDALIQDWMIAGCPLEWNLDNIEKNKNTYIVEYLDGKIMLYKAYSITSLLENLYYYKTMSYYSSDLFTSISNLSNDIKSIIDLKTLKYIIDKSDISDENAIDKILDYVSS